MQMDLAGFAVSAGSACSSGKVRPSRVLAAMGLGPEVAASAIRVSIGPTTTRDEVLAFAGAWERHYRRFRAQGRVSGEEGRRWPHSTRSPLREGVDQETVDAVRSVGERYKYGFATDIETEFAPKGLNEDIVRLISEKNGEPEWLTEWRLKAYRRWVQLEEQPTWAMLELPEIDFQDQYYYARPKSMAVRPKSLDEVDPALLATYEKLGIPLKEQMILAGRRGRRRRAGRGAQGGGRRGLRPVSLGTTFKDELAKAGVIFCSISEAMREHPELVRKYLGTRRALQRQLLCDAELGGVLGRLVRLRAAGRALPDGALDLLPDQRREHRPVRAHADHRRQGQLRQLPRGLHRAEARHQPAARGGGRDRRARGRRGEVLDGAELVPRRRGGPGRHLQLRHQARRLPRGAGEGDVDAGRDRLGDHLEVPVVHPARRGQPGRVLLDRHRQQPPAGRHRHQDAPPRQEHPVADRLEGDQRRARAEHLPRAGRRCIRRRPAAATTPSATAC